MKSLSIYLAITLSFLIVGGHNSFGQKKESVKNKFQYEKKHDGTKILEARLFLKTKSGLVGIPSAVISYSASDDSTTVKLGDVVTDADGWGLLHIEEGFVIPQNPDGSTTYEVAYKGNDTLKKMEDDLKIKDLVLSITLEETEEEKNVTVSVTNLMNEPVDRAKVKFYVERLYSLLPVGDERTDSTGKVQFIVPNDIPGDFDGNIVLVAAIEKDRKYGNISIHKTANWGIPNTYTVSEERRNLWSQSAPAWMQIAVLSVFAIVAVFFFYSIYQVFMIPKDI